MAVESVKSIKAPALPPEIEVVNASLTRGRIRYALFDFDGTLSLIREGWQQVMIPMMVELLLRTPRCEARALAEQTVREFVARLTGKQTIFQMIQLAEEIGKRGGKPDDPQKYKEMYLERLARCTSGRIELLKRRPAAADEMMVPGSRELLEDLRRRGVSCYLASGTDEKDVIEEAELLGLTGYFSAIQGAQRDYKSFSKKMVVERLIREHRLDGCEFVAFGDGYVEIEETKLVNGIAVGVASNEAERQGLDDWKRSRLLKAGADLIVPDYRQGPALLAYLFEA